MARRWSAILYYSGLILAGLGALSQSKELMAGGTLAVALGYGLTDYFSARPDSITPMTINALVFGVWIGLGHLVACFVVNTRYEATFYSYAAMDFLLEAQYLATLTVIVPLVTYRWFTTLQGGSRRFLPRVPAVALEVSDRTLLICCLALLAFDSAGKLFTFSFEFLGTLAGFLSKSSEIAIFLLTWHWLGPSPTLPKWTRGLLGLWIIFDVVYAAAFSYMRGEMAAPLFAFFLAFLLRKLVTKRVAVIASLVIVVFGGVYKIIGETRGSGIFGSERFEIIREEFLSYGSDGNRTPKDQRDDFPLMPLIARGCHFGQLSQVVRIADAEGYYYGATLEYLSYAFIPRIIWPEKPLITPGQWFAEKIGRGSQISETQFSNSIDMSVAGELYLNFGWAGAIVGLTLMAVLYGVFWESAGFYGTGNNPTGQVLAIAILLQATGGSSAGAIVQLVFFYLGALTISLVFMSFLKRTKTTRTPGPRRMAGSGIADG